MKFPPLFSMFLMFFPKILVLMSMIGMILTLFEGHCWLSIAFCHWRWPQRLTPFNLSLDPQNCQGSLLSWDKKFLLDLLCRCVQFNMQYAEARWLCRTLKHPMHVPFRDLPKCAGCTCLLVGINSCSKFEISFCTCHMYHQTWNDLPRRRRTFGRKHRKV